jgi:hypothetical protein
MHQLEGHTARIELGERTAIGRPDRAAVDEHDAARLQRGDRRGHRVRAESDAEQAFVPRDIGSVLRRLDQLQEELRQGLSSSTPLLTTPKNWPLGSTVKPNSDW